MLLEFTDCQEDVFYERVGEELVIIFFLFHSQFGFAQRGLQRSRSTGERQFSFYCHALACVSGYDFTYSSHVKCTRVLRIMKIEERHVAELAIIPFLELYNSFDFVQSCIE